MSSPASPTRHSDSDAATNVSADAVPTIAVVPVGQQAAPEQADRGSSCKCPSVVALLRRAVITMPLDEYMRARFAEVQANHRAVRGWGDMVVSFGGLLIGALFLVRFAVEAVEPPLLVQQPPLQDADTLTQPPTRDLVGGCNIGAFVAELHASDETDE